MRDLLVKLFVKNSEDVENSRVRTAYGILASFVAVFCNCLLFVLKLFIGMLIGSVSVTADAFNNLSDAASGVVSYIGVRMAGKPADEKHPFGHGRIEYITAFIVAFVVMEVGFTFLKESVDKIKSPEQVTVTRAVVAALLLSIAVKLWLAFFNKTLGKRINSKVMAATGADALGDVVITSATIVSILISALTGLNIDGYAGLLVAVFVMWSGFCIARETLEPLIGEAIDPGLYQQITEMVEGYDGILGSHDLIVHNYGPSKYMASIHVEVARETDVLISHEIVDRIERETAKKLGIFLVIHMDPIESENERVMETKARVEQILEQTDDQLSLHDFRMVDGAEQINLIFDIVVPHEYGRDKTDQIRECLIEEIKKQDKRYNPVLTFEKSFVAVEKN